MELHAQCAISSGVSPKLHVNMVKHIELYGWDFCAHNERMDLMLSVVAVPEENFVQFLSWA